MKYRYFRRKMLQQARPYVWLGTAVAMVILYVFGWLDFPSL